jgi:hypothetical protein
MQNFGRKPEGKKSLERSRRRWVDKMDLKGGSRMRTLSCGSGKTPVASFCGKGRTFGFHKDKLKDYQLLKGTLLC